MATQTKKHYEQYGSELYWLADNIALILAENKLDGTSQKEQVEELFLAERLFKEEILKCKYSAQVYKKFIQKIKYVDRNILSAKVYFRESGENFSKNITPFLKSGDPEGLKKFSVNFNLIKLIRENWRGPLGTKAEKLYLRVEEARRILIENNMPLAINAAKLFYRKVPKSPQCNLMDMISVSIQGLANAVDKYQGVAGTGEYSEVFRSVILNRCTGNLIREYSTTSLHFYPSDRKIMYKANSIRGRQGITEVTELANAVNEAFLADSKEGMAVPKNKVTASELQELLHATSLVSVECTFDEDSYSAYDYTPDENDNAEEALIRTETGDTISKLIEKMPPIYKKVLKLRGVSF